MARWPKDNQTALIAFYGDPGSHEVAEQLVKVTPPFKMYYDGKPLRTLSFHKKAAPALLAALNKVWDHYGRDQGAIDNLGISKTAGTYNPRKVRGSATKWSNHAYGAAIDINAEQNGFNVVGNIPRPMIAAFKSEGARWGGDYKSRPDPMHFEFCESGEPKRSFEQWLTVLGVKDKPKDKPPVVVPDFEPEPVAPPTPVPPAPAGVSGDPEVYHVQRRLKAMTYNPGELDGLWGGYTAGAITGFINDRQLAIEPPASVEAFNAVREQLKLELARAETERFTRPIAPERSEVTPKDLAPKLPEVDASIKAERGTFWGAIATAVSAVITGVAQFFKDAVEWLNPIKEFVGDLPWPVWVGGALAIAGALYYISTKSGQAKDAATQAYKEGSRA